MVENRCGDVRDNVVRVTYLFLDLSVCDRCIGTEDVLDEVMCELGPVLESKGYRIIYEKQEVTSAEIAEKYRFISSPTILVNGRDIFDTVIEKDCGCCGKIAGDKIDCRVYEYDGRLLDVPPKKMIAEAVLRKVCEEDMDADEEYVLPDNLRRFFEGRKRRTLSVRSGRRVKVRKV